MNPIMPMSNDRGTANLNVHVLFDTPSANSRTKRNRRMSNPERSMQRYGGPLRRTRSGEVLYHYNALQSKMLALEQAEYR